MTHKTTWCGKNLSDMTKEELIEDLENLAQMREQEKNERTREDAVLSTFRRFVVVGPA